MLSAHMLGDTAADSNVHGIFLKIARAKKTRQGKKKKLKIEIKKSPSWICGFLFVDAI